MTAALPCAARLVKVAVDAPLKKPLTYLLPERLAAAAVIGQRALVPLGRRQVTGYLVGFPDASSLAPEKIKAVLELIDPEPLFNERELALFTWAARYYFSSLTEVIKTALPAGINVASVKTICLTDAGREFLQKIEAGFAETEPIPDLSEEELDFLLTLGEGYITLPKSRKPGEAKPASRLLKKLRDLDLISDDQALAKPRVKQKTEPALELLRAPTPDEMAALSRRAKARAQLLTELLERKLIPLAELRGRYRDPSALGKALAAQGLARRLEVPVARDPFSLPLQLDPPPTTLMPEQAAAIETIGAALSAAAFQVFLLHGVTGSGKTEVYIRAIEQARRQGRGAIMLVPEIALTPQLIARFQQRFAAADLAVLHSGLTPGERHDEWKRIRSGEARIVMGARSAVFAPVKNLGVIVVDEEQDSAYKQDHGFRYQARDLAVKRGQEESAVVILGSATPSLESVWRSRQPAGYTLLSLPHRVDRRPLAEIELVDLREIKVEEGEKAAAVVAEKLAPDRDRLAAEHLLSGRLREAIAATLGRGEQVILFLNRRGISTFMVCFDCGQRFVCPNCAVSLCHHRAPTGRPVDRFYGEPDPAGYLLCHYCGFHTGVPAVCPQCRGLRVHPFGVGVEKLAEVTTSLFPAARVLRMDSDVMTGRESYFRALDQIHRREIDIIVGTQMVAKGHDLPFVTLVGVLLADVSLNQPDFRAAERTFTLLTQVAGRAGRGQAPGRVIIQTFAPEHYAVLAAVAQDFSGFSEQELLSRKPLWYPPFARLANFRITGRNQPAVKESAQLLGRLARQKAAAKAARDHIKILGPVAAPIGRLRGKTRWMMLVKADAAPNLSRFCETLLAALAEKTLPAGVQLEVDRDPVSLM